MSIFKRMIISIRSIWCRHEYYIEDIQKTHIKPPPMPDGDYLETMAYYRTVFNHDWYTKRISCACRKCEKVAYSHCGLGLPGRLKQKRDGAL